MFLQVCCDGIHLLYHILPTLWLLTLDNIHSRVMGIMKNTNKLAKPHWIQTETGYKLVRYKIGRRTRKHTHGRTRFWSSARSISLGVITGSILGCAYLQSFSGITVGALYPHVFATEVMEVSEVPKTISEPILVHSVGSFTVTGEASVSASVNRESTMAHKTAGCVRNHPDIADKLRSTFSEEEEYILDLICRESSLNPEAINPSSGACGLFQALPCSKLGCELTDVECQINWGKRYIEDRYGSVKAAIRFHNLHNWY